MVWKKEYNKSRLKRFSSEEKYQEFLIQKQKSYHKHKNEISIRRKKTREELKTRILNHYGDKCKCCGEKHREFLALNHIKGGGNKHRKSINSTGGWTFYRWIEKNNYPKGFNILCHNCNMAEGLYGVCPHKK